MKHPIYKALLSGFILAAQIVAVVISGENPFLTCISEMHFPQHFFLRSSWA